MSTEVAVAGETAASRFEASLEAEAAAERDLLKSLVMAILVALPGPIPNAGLHQKNSTMTSDALPWPKFQTCA